MSELPQTSTERLYAIADHLEAHPELWNQRIWVEGVTIVREWAGKGTCGTPGCIAGHAVMLTPPDQLAGFNGWRDAGVVALGLDESLETIFETCYRPANLPEALRRLAELPVPRTARDAIKAEVDLTGAWIDADLRGLDCSYLGEGARLWGCTADETTKLPEGWRVDDGLVVKS